MAVILVIDDDESVRSTIGTILTRAGHQVLQAADGRKGLSVLRSTKVDLIITDIIMPEQEGIETILEVRRSDPKTQIIAISGGGRNRNLDFLSVARKLGATHILPKPFRAAELLELVNLSLSCP